MNVLRALRNPLRLLRHPLNRERKLHAAARWFAWKLGSRLVPGPVVFGFVNESTLIVEPGLNAATCNLYTGIYEFEEMAFVLHFLRDGDLFIDVGANIGAYTVLAAGVCSATSIAVEPVPATYAHLIRNLNLNGIRDKVDARNIGISDKRGRLRFTAGQDSVNHVATNDELMRSETVEVEVRTLDEVSPAAGVPTLLKIDVEGYETNVIEGGAKTISNDALRAVVIELNGSGRRYGFEDSVLHERMLRFGFEAYCYRPFQRLLEPLSRQDTTRDNTLYVRDRDFVSERLRSARSFRTNGYEI